MTLDNVFLKREKLQKCFLDFGNIFTLTIHQTQVRLRTELKFSHTEFIL